jgi:hypothetical protein
MKYVIVVAVAGSASNDARQRRLDKHTKIVIIEKGAYESRYA